jgi:hypothetical protein
VVIVLCGGMLFWTGHDLPALMETARKAKLEANQPEPPSDNPA